jgi:hypothetical protein
MKIRIKGNSLRYRLTQSEVVKVWREGLLEEQTKLIPETFIYAIKVGDTEQLSAEFTGNKIILHISKAMIEELHDTQRVGFDGWSGSVRLLIEKDFTCLDNTEEDQSDNYPNPCQKAD